MASSSYNANIVLNVQNQASLDRVGVSLNRIQGLLKQIKPINLLAPGRGAGAEQIKVTFQKISDRAKTLAGNINQISATLAGASGQASAFKEVLANIKIKPLDKDDLEEGKNLLEVQSDQVKNIAKAFVETEKKASVYQKRLNEIIRLQKGLQSQATRDFEVARRQRLVRDRAPRTRLGGIEPGGGYKNLEANLKRIQHIERQIREGRAKDTEKLMQLKALNQGIERSLAKMSEHGAKKA